MVKQKTPKRESSTESETTSSSGATAISSASDSTASPSATCATPTESLYSMGETLPPPAMPRLPSPSRGKGRLESMPPARSNISPTRSSTRTPPAVTAALAEEVRNLTPSGETGEGSGMDSGSSSSRPPSSRLPADEAPRPANVNLSMIRRLIARLRPLYNRTLDRKEFLELFFFCIGLLLSVVLILMGIIMGVAGRDKTEPLVVCGVLITSGCLLLGFVVYKRCIQMIRESNVM